MRRIKITGLVMLAVLATGAIATSVAAARKPPPVLEEEPTGKPIEPGDPLVLTSDQLDLVTSAGTIECTSNQIGATLTSNGLKTDSFSIGPMSFSGPDGRPCTGPTSLGDPTITGISAGGTGTLNTVAGKVEIAPGPPDFELTASFPDGTQCTWSAAQLKGTFNLDGRPVRVNEAQERVKSGGGTGGGGRNPRCPRGTGRLSTVWSLSTIGATGELVPAVIGNPNL